MGISLNDVQRGYDRWAAKPHNAKWVRKIDGTPIPNDIVVNIFDALKDRPSETAVKVRELEWNAEPPYHVARGNAGGHYSIERVDSHVVYFELRGNSIWPIKRFASMTEAKAASQQDYERRILSALVPSTPAESRCEELVKALKDRDEEIARYQGLLDAAIDDYNNARNTALEEAASHVEGMFDNAGFPLLNRHRIADGIRALIRDRKPTDDLKEAEGVGE